MSGRTVVILLTIIQMIGWASVAYYMSKLRGIGISCLSEPAKRIKFWLLAAGIAALNIAAIVLLIKGMPDHSKVMSYAGVALTLIQLNMPYSRWNGERNGGKGDEPGERLGE